MKTVKKFLSVLMILIMVLTALPLTVVESSATALTQSQAVSWAQSQVGKSLDHDGVYGAQCVDLIRFYYAYLGVSPQSGNGCDYATNALPTDWSRIQYNNGFVPQPGDIAVWTYASSSSGHVAIVTSADSSTMNVVEQNGSTGITREHTYNYSYGTFYGVIRPNFEGAKSVQLQINGTTIQESCYKLGSSLTFCHTADYANSYHLYIYYTPFDWSSTELYFEGEFSQNSSTNRTFYKDGHYSAYCVIHTSSGDYESGWIGFNIVDNPTVKVNPLSVYTGNEVSFLVSETCALSYHLYIYKGSEKLFEGEFNNNEPYSRVFTQDGHYSCYVIVHYPNLDLESNWVGFDVMVSPIQYTITYDANGGSNAPNPQTKLEGESIFLSSTYPIRTGYTFLGWSTSADATDIEYIPNSSYTTDANLILYANWNANTYTVKYNANGGTGTMSDSSHTYDTAKALTANTFTRTGYTFLGWSTSPTATTATYTDKQSVKNLTTTNGGTITLYAVWQENPATVSSISMRTLPTKTVYTVGEVFSSNGLSVKVNMSDGTSKTITEGFTVSAPDMTTAGTKTVTVSYSGKTTSFTVTVQSGTPALTVDSRNAVCGQRIKVPVILEKAELGTLIMDITYDSAILQLVSVEGIPFEISKVNTATAGKIRITAMDTTFVTAGTIAVLTFDVVADSACSTDISVSVDRAYDADDNEVALTVFNGTMEITKPVYGDVNGDGTPDSADYSMIKAYAIGNESLDLGQKYVSDLNRDGAVDAYDAIYLDLYLNGYLDTL